MNNESSQSEESSQPISVDTTTESISSRNRKTILWAIGGLAIVALIVTINLNSPTNTSLGGVLFQCGIAVGAIILAALICVLVPSGAVKSEEELDKKRQELFGYLVAFSVEFGVSLLIAAGCTSIIGDVLGAMFVGESESPTFRLVGFATGAGVFLLYSIARMRRQGVTSVTKIKPGAFSISVFACCHVAVGILVGALIGAMLFADIMQAIHGLVSNAAEKGGVVFWLIVITGGGFGISSAILKVLRAIRSEPDQEDAA